MISYQRIFRCFVLLALLAGGRLAPTLAAAEIWRLDQLGTLGGHPVTVYGSPRLVADGDRRVVAFDGKADGLLVPSIPIAGAKQFTIEILFKPAEGGPEAQRFLHVEDAVQGRAMIETRLDGKGGWWLDTFLLSEGRRPGLALIDPARVHPTDRWYWAALRYDGTTMAHYVDGVKELEGTITFVPLRAGQTSLGVRQNKVYWFRGEIAEVRFHAEALPPAQLQRVRAP